MDVVSSPAGGGIGISSASASSVSGSGGAGGATGSAALLKKDVKVTGASAASGAAGAGSTSTVGGAGQKAAPSHRAVMTERLKQLWGGQLAEMEALGVSNKQAFKHHNDLPLARIKRIMKSDEDVRMISAEAPILFAKACEIFILDLAVRSWVYAETNKHTGLEKEDICTVLRRTDVFDFLTEAVINHPAPREARRGGSRR